jgi:hypothetical protein
MPGAIRPAWRVASLDRDRETDVPSKLAESFSGGRRAEHRKRRLRFQRHHRAALKDEGREGVDLGKEAFSTAVGALSPSTRGGAPVA